MNNTGIFNHLKQAKDPTIIRELNRYIKFCAKMAEAQATVQFLKGCIIRSEYPKQYPKILKRNHIKLTKASLQRQALNQIDIFNSQLDIFKDNVMRTEHG